jgi:2-methylisocitrate lyase-like PEP mutase family enzyme
MTIVAMLAPSRTVGSRCNRHGTRTIPAPGRRTIPPLDGGWTVRGVSREAAIADDGVMLTEPSYDKAAALLELHAGPGFVLPNAWDAGSARILDQVGFPAIATTSAGIAWSCGVPDGGALDRDAMLEHVGRLVAAVSVPVSADLEAGYGATADDVALTVSRAVELGVVGCNLEDAGPGGLFGIDEAADRIAAARTAAPRGTFVLNARTDTYFAGTTGDAFGETVERALRYVEAGADCVFVPGVVEEDAIRRLADAIPGPLNVVAGLANTIDAPTLFSLGVKRVSLGGSLARAALSMVELAGRELLDSGTLGFLDGAIGYADLQRRFGS